MILEDASMQQLFLAARSHNAWLPKTVSSDQLQHLYDLARMGPTSANCSPARFVFIQSAQAKEKLKAFMDKGNVNKMMTAPITAIIGTDYDFFEKLPQLFPHTDAKSWFVGNQAKIDVTAFRNGTLQAAYLMLAARAIGLDCGPMSGFDNAGVDAAFFAGSNVRSNFLVSLGYGDPAGLFGRSPRLSFDQCCKIL
jgi:3-hydroxypropanoate dehydrogenase